MYGPAIAGTTVALRAPRPDEIPALAAGWAAVHQTDRFVPNGDRLETAAQVEERLRAWATDERRLIWLLEHAGEAAGSANLRDIEWIDRSATHGTHVYERFRRRGIATEVVALRARYAFAELGLNKLYTDTWDANVAMKRALLRAGYREVGVRRKEFYRDGAWHDLWLGELLREDWERAADRA